jgi:hypothetical protein
MEETSMHRLRKLLTLALVVPALGFLVVASGCGGGDKPPEATTSTGTTSGGTKTTQGPLVVKEFGTIKGRVTLQGSRPAIGDLKDRDDFKANQDRDHCLKAPSTADPSWVIGQDNGVANVVVWVKPPDGQFFVVPEDQRTRTDTIEVDQPYCAFEPHVLVAFPKYRDEAGKEHPTGQKFEVKNSAPINHNTKFQGSTKSNPGANLVIQAKGKQEFSLNPDRQAINLSCDIHKWMTGYVWAFDHPYATVTDQNGNFELQVPAGSKIYVVGWHEKGGYLPSNKGQEVEVKPGEAKEVNLSVKAP